MKVTFPNIGAEQFRENRFRSSWLVNCRRDCDGYRPDTLVGDSIQSPLFCRRFIFADELAALNIRYNRENIVTAVIVSRIVPPLELIDHKVFQATQDGG